MRKFSIPLNVSCTVSEIFSVKTAVTLKPGKGRSRSLKMAPFQVLYTTFYWSAIVSIALGCTISCYLTLNNRDPGIWVIGH